MTLLNLFGLTKITELEALRRENAELVALLEQKANIIRELQDNLNEQRENAKKLYCYNKELEKANNDMTATLEKKGWFKTMGQLRGARQTISKLTAELNKYKCKA